MANKSPAFLFYTNDFSSGTQFFSDEQLGKYIRLLMAQHQHGHLSELQVLHICKTYDKHIMQKFIKDEEGNFYNERLQTEIDKRVAYSQSRKSNKLGKVKDVTYDATYDEHMENENIYITNIVDTEIHNTEVLKDKKSKKQREEELIIEKATAFYSIQIELAKDSQDLKSYRAFVNYLFLTNPMRVPQIHILKLNSQLTYEQFTSLLDSSGKDLKKILEKVDVMINTPDYLKNKQTIYFTINKWLKNNF